MLDSRATGAKASFHDTFGALFIGALVTMAVYGITTLQTYLYFMAFPKDGIRTRLLVAAIWILDTVHAIFMCHTMYYYLVDSFGVMTALAVGKWSLFASVAVNVILAFIVQCFFVEKIYRLCTPSRRKWVAGTIFFLVFSHFVLGIETVVFLFIKKDFERLKDATKVAVVPFGVVATVSDIAIAVTLCVLLDSNRSSFDDTNSIINRLIVFAINRCILTSAMAIAETIIFAVTPNSFYSIALDFVIGKLYANSLLAVLNSRAALRHEHRDEVSSTELSTSFRAASGATPYQSANIQMRTRETADESLSASEKGVSSL